MTSDVFLFGFERHIEKHDIETTKLIEKNVSPVASGKGVINCPTIQYSGNWMGVLPNANMQIVQIVVLLAVSSKLRVIFA